MMVTSELKKLNYLVKTHRIYNTNFQIPIQTFLASRNIDWAPIKLICRLWPKDDKSDYHFPVVYDSKGTRIARDNPWSPEYIRDSHEMLRFIIAYLNELPWFERVKFSIDEPSVASTFSKYRPSVKFKVLQSLIALDRMPQEERWKMDKTIAQYVLCNLKGFTPKEVGKGIDYLEGVFDKLFASKYYIIEAPVNTTQQEFNRDVLSGKFMPWRGYYGRKNIQALKQVIEYVLEDLSK